MATCRRYHPSIGLPPNLILPDGWNFLLPTVHAVEEAAKDDLTIPSVLVVARATLFEVFVDEDGYIEKIGYRLPHDEVRDICLMVRLDGPHWRVVTCWANLKTDTHRTLRAQPYSLCI